MMTKDEFLSECLKRLIDPAIALENENVIEALGNKKDELVKQLLDSEF